MGAFKNEEIMFVTTKDRAKSVQKGGNDRSLTGLEEGKEGRRIGGGRALI